jgi:hypothetical protein
LMIGTLNTLFLTSCLEANACKTADFLKATMALAQIQYAVDAFLPSTRGLTPKEMAAYAACHSFLPDTEVLMADGRHKKIKDVKQGDKVVATDPLTGKNRAREVEKHITTKGDKDFATITVTNGTSTSTLVATVNHPFWIENTHTWLNAGNLKPGLRLHSASSTPVTVRSVRITHHRQTTNDLTVAVTHTYYVLAGDAPVLVHNCDVALGLKSENTYSWADKLGFKHFGDYAADEWQGPVESAIRDPSVRLHVNLGGLGNFIDAAKAGLQPGAYATDTEMGWIARAVANGERSWSSVTFYRRDAKGKLRSVPVPEPDWSQFGRLRPFISDAQPYCGC